MGRRPEKLFYTSTDIVINMVIITWNHTKPNGNGNNECHLQRAQPRDHITRWWRRRWDGDDDVLRILRMSSAEKGHRRRVGAWFSKYLGEIKIVMECLAPFFDVGFLFCNGTTVHRSWLAQAHKFHLHYQLVVLPSRIKCNFYVNDHIVKIAPPPED